MPDRRFDHSGDDGAPDDRLAAALAGWAGAPAPTTRAEVLAALADARVFLALAARATAVETTSTGLRQEREAEMALLSVVGGDGSRVLPAFCDGHEVQRWRAEARPVPVPGPLACATAREDGAVGLLLDPPRAAFVTTPAELEALAAGRVPVPGTGVSTRRASSADIALGEPTTPPDPALVRALGSALRDEPVRAARLLAGPSGPVLGVVPVRPLPPAALAALADRLVRRLGAHLPAAGLDLAVVPPGGPGVPVPLPRRLLPRRRRA